MLCSVNYRQKNFAIDQYQKMKNYNYHLGQLFILYLRLKSSAGFLMECHNYICHFHIQVANLVITILPACK